MLASPAGAESPLSPSEVQDAEGDVWVRVYEQERLNALHSYHILDTPPEVSFDRITRLVAQALNTSSAMINFVDRERLWSKSVYGADLVDVPRANTICEHTLKATDVVTVEDLSAHTTFAALPLVKDGGARSYAGFPLRTQDGYALGTLCVLDTTPRRLDQQQLALLRDFAALVLTELDLRAEAASRRRSERLLTDQTQILEQIAFGGSGKEVLETLCHLIERHIPAAIAAVSVLDTENGHFVEMVAPHFPAELMTGMIGTAIAGMSGPSAAAAYLGQSVSVYDLTAEPVLVERAIGIDHWQPTSTVRTYLLSHHIQACWATPIFSTDGRALGTVAVYFPTPRRLSDEERLLLGNLVYIAGIAIQHDRTQHAVIESEARYRLLAENVNDLHMLYHADGRCLWLSPSLTSMLGYTPADVIAILPFAFVHPDDQAQAMADHTAVLSGRRITNVYRVRHKDGHFLWLETSAIPWYDEHGTVIGVQTASRDVSARKQGEREQIHSAQRISALHSIGRAVLAASSNQEVAEAALAHLPPLLQCDLCSIYELDSATQELVVLAVKPHQPPSLPPLHRIPLSSLRRTQDLETGRVYAVDDISLLSSPSDIERQVAAWGVRSFLAAPMHVDQKLIGFLHVAAWQPNVYTAQDRSVLREVADMLAVAFHQNAYKEELIRARDRAEEINRLKSAFLANMSHEIRTPLVSILGFSDVLAEEVEGPARQHVDLVRRSGRRLMETLDSVLELARLESGVMRLKPVLIDVVQVVQELVTMFDTQIAERNLTLQCTFPTKAIYTEIDPAALTRVFNNLMSNALKFTPKGTISVEVSSQKGEVELSIADTGIGIDSDFFPHLFEEFQQESGGVDRAFGGVGLGMAITKHLVELMDGQISVESTKGEGTCFSVRLPIRLGQNTLKADESETQAQAVEPISKPFSKADLLTLLSRLLSQATSPSS